MEGLSMLRLNEFRQKAHGLPDLLNYAFLAQDGIVQGKDGSLMASWYFRGEDMASATHRELASLSSRLNGLLATFGSGWMLHCDAIRRFTVGYPTRGAFPDRTTLVIDEERRRLYEAEGLHLETIYALTLTYLPPRKIEGKMVALLYEGGASRETSDEAVGERILFQFNRRMEEFEAVLGGIFSVKRMRGVRQTDASGRECIADQQLQYLEYCISGELRPVRLPSVPMYFDTLIGCHVFASGVEPRIDDQYIKIVAIDGFPGESHPGILHVLDELNCPYRWSTRFIFLDGYQARGILSGVRRRWQQKQRGLKDQIFKTSRGAVNLDAVAMTSDTEVAIAEVESNLVRFGYYTSVVVLIGNDQQQILEQAGEVRKAILNQGFGARVEDVNTVEAFLGSLPGHGYQNIRRPIIHTLNLSDLLPTTSVWAGLDFHPSPFYPPMSPPLLHASTTGSTPFRLCLHVDDVGHALMLGPTGAGKTTALNFMAAQHFRYPRSRVFGFDRKNGTYVLCKAAGGNYYDIGADDFSLSFCPLQDIDTPTDQAWAAEWVETCLVLQGLTPTPSMRTLIYQAIVRLSGSPSRSLTEFVSQVQDNDLREALAHYTLSGPMGNLLDASTDNLGDSHFMIFEMEHLSQLGEKNTVPVLLYLFRQIEKRLNGAPTLVPLDESWLMLTHPMFREKLREWLKTLRSKNANVLLATQEPSDVLNSPIRDVVLASCPVKILLANPDAAGVQRSMYEIMGLNEREIEIISTATKKRHYYYTSPLGRRLFSLGLGPVAMSFVGATGKEDTSQAKALIQQFGQTWPEEWLRAKGLANWADYWMRLS
jgi:type IV secretion system protein TrbE